jgi:hypothetical protein
MKQSWLSQSLRTEDVWPADITKSHRVDQTMALLVCMEHHAGEG